MSRDTIRSIVSLTVSVAIGVGFYFFITKPVASALSSWIIAGQEQENQDRLTVTLPDSGNGFYTCDFQGVDLTVAVNIVSEGSAVDAETSENCFHSATAPEMPVRDTPPDYTITGAVIPSLLGGSFLCVKVTPEGAEGNRSGCTYFSSGDATWSTL